MREIKFRAWTGMEMEYRIVVGKLGSFYVEGLDPKDSACMSPFNTKYGEQTPIMQFTGLHDKNGKEIYEGDIVNYGDYSDGSGPCDYVVEWSAEDAAFKGRAIHELDMVAGLDPSGEVIGNIYENPGLIT